MMTLPEPPLSEVDDSRPVSLIPPTPIPHGGARSTRRPFLLILNSVLMVLVALTLLIFYGNQAVESIPIIKMNLSDSYVWFWIFFYPVILLFNSYKLVLAWLLLRLNVRAWRQTLFLAVGEILLDSLIYTIAAVHNYLRVGAKLYEFIIMICVSISCAVLLCGFPLLLLTRKSVRDAFRAQPD